MMKYNHTIIDTDVIILVKVHHLGKDANIQQYKIPMSLHTNKKLLRLVKSKVK